MHRLLLLLLLAGCYPVCVSDADCDHGYCQVSAKSRQCISCDPDGRPCLDGEICTAVNQCSACQSDDQCGDGFICASDGTCQAVESDDGGSD